MTFQKQNIHKGKRYIFQKFQNTCILWIKNYDPPTNTTQILLQGPNKNIQVLYSKLIRHNENLIDQKIDANDLNFCSKKKVTQVP